MNFNFDLDKIFDAVKSIAFSIIKIPFKIWKVLPIWLKFIIIGFLSIIGLILLILAWKKRDDWMYVRV